ncbi:MAG: hypothetical protein RDV48_10950 [Candidatus Eremiobacteraeota bacterium]|nr:hypothetical protein [Candidatus Eremiobacteraeota bacterium]
MTLTGDLMAMAAITAPSIGRFLQNMQHVGLGRQFLKRADQEKAGEDDYEIVWDAFESRREECLPGEGRPAAETRQEGVEQVPAGKPSLPQETVPAGREMAAPVLEERDADKVAHNEWLIAGGSRSPSIMAKKADVPDPGDMAVINEAARQKHLVKLLTILYDLNTEITLMIAESAAKRFKVMMKIADKWASALGGSD